MHRRTTLLFVLTFSAACGGRADVAPLDRDSTLLVGAAAPATVGVDGAEGQSPAGSPSAQVTALLDSASDALAHDEVGRASAHLTNAAATADRDPALLYQVAQTSERLGAASTAERVPPLPGGRAEGPACERRARAPDLAGCPHGDAGATVGGERS